MSSHFDPGGHSGWSILSSSPVGKSQHSPFCSEEEALWHLSLTPVVNKTALKVGDPVWGSAKAIYFGSRQGLKFQKRKNSRYVPSLNVKGRAFGLIKHQLGLSFHYTK